MAGIDHNKANVDIRALFSFTKKHAAASMEKWKQLPGISGCVILSTCNRMELWVNTKDEYQGTLLDLLCEWKGVPVEQYAPYFVVREGDEAVDHLFHLTSGLKSLILAEDQIITQVKDALSMAREVFATDNVLEVLFRKAITAGKKVKTNVVFSRASQTSMDRAIDMLRSEGFLLQDAACMVIGNGEMGKLAAQSLRQAGACVTVTVRQYRSGMVSIPEGCDRINYGERLDALPNCDLVVSATASPNYTLTMEQMQSATIKEGLVLIDLAVPRDMEPEIAGLSGVKLYTIDDFKLEGPDAALKESLEQAEQIIHEEIDEFYVWYKGRNMIPRINGIRDKAITDLDWRLHKMLHKLPMEEEEIRLLEQAIQTSAGKVITKLIFGLRDSLPPEEFLDCVEGLEQTYEE